jgi:hypothetical protein
MNKEFIILIFGVLIVIAAVVILMNITYDPLDDFNGPSYIPDNYNLSRNNTTENSTFLLYKGSTRINFFLVGAVRDQNKSVINNIKPSFNNSTAQNANLHILEDKINVTGHQVIVKREEINFFGTFVSFFETSWYCDNSRLTLVVSGVVPSSDMPKILKMIESIQCHKTFLF